MLSKPRCWAAAREHEKPHGGARRAHAFAVRTFPVMIIPNLSKLLDFGCLVRSSSLFFRGAQDLKKIISPVDLYNDLLELTKMLLLGAAKNIMICYN